ncbi:hypothetical protein [Paenibacillus segetis]|uniref:Lipocalin-like domain-containing protein n=1 Tax=Paenibacillus segetis TaxID=1325360 RepID=A0ABQ1YJF2_9BACL|nr:hypothetical protein [Paenibacillus segetis]GGH27098.1 hypothetical protein GCM10008013_28360 [Paenibacillus segetis]
MRKWLVLTMLLVLSLTLISCSKSNQSLLLGVWEADQASQKEGTEESITGYNHWEVSEGKIICKNFNFEIQGDKEIKKFTDETRELQYTWESNNQLKIDNQVFEIKMKKNEMNIINENVDVHFNRQK